MYQSYSRQSETSATPDRVKKLRTQLQGLLLDGFIVPHGDEFQNEYLPACNKRLLWLTGFAGSAGMAIILANKAAIFIDGRYTLQVTNEVDMDLFEPLQVPHNKPADWIVQNVKGKTRIGYDPRLMTLKTIENMRKLVARKNPDCLFVALDENPLDLIWADRPAQPLTPVSLHPVKYAGQKASAKIAVLQKELVNAKLDACLLTDQASIAWLFNIRGKDVPHTPLALSYAILHARKKPELMIDPQKLGKVVKEKLGKDVRISPMSKLAQRLEALGARKSRIAIDPAKTSCWFNDRLQEQSELEIVHRADPCTLPKAIKNKTEIDGTRAAHIRDGVAVSRFLCWLDTKAAKDIDEITAARKLEAFRMQTGQLRDLSFETISGSGANGAIVHYRVDEQSNKTFTKNSLFLVDSGGQYLDGTTDITRTVAIGKASREMCRHFTLVLKGHIAIATSRFPKGTRGVDLDGLARMALWKAGLDYDHGTGHGVGAFLGVHEGPQGISKAAMTPFAPGMVVSNEPGFYKTGSYGIRIENLVLVTPEQKPTGGERPMLGFETLTMVPLDSSLIDTDLLDRFEISWLNDYHKQVHRLISPHLETDKERKWLKRSTKAL